MAPIPCKIPRGKEQHFELERLKFWKRKRWSVTERRLQFARARKGMSDNKSKKNEANKEIITMSDAAGVLDRWVGDVSKKSATKQILIGAGSGWATGYITMKVGKAAAIAVGGGIILLQIANQQGYISIDWNKINKKVDKVTDKVEEAVTGQGPSWADKAERFVDRKLNQAEDALKHKSKKARKWYTNLIGDDSGCKLNDLHVFVCAFAAGVAIGIGTA